MSDLNLSPVNWTAAVPFERFGGSAQAADNAAALVRALAAKVPLYFARTYQFTSPVALTVGAVLTGPGKLNFAHGSLMANGIVGFQLLGIQVVSADAAAISVANSSNFTIERVASDGAYLHGLSLSACHDFKVHNCDIKNVGLTIPSITASSQGMGIYLTQCYAFEVRGNEVQGTAGNGAIFGYQCFDGVVDNNLLHDTWYRGIDFEGTVAAGVMPSDTRGLRNRFTNNKVWNTGAINTKTGANSSVGQNGIFVNNKGPIGNQFDDAYIKGNIVNHVGENCIEAHGHIEENDVGKTGVFGGNTPSLEGIYASSWSIVQRNTVRTPLGSGVKFPNDASSNYVVRGNTVWLPGGNGFDRNYTYGGTGRVTNFVMEDNYVAMQAGSPNRAYFIGATMGTVVYDESCLFARNTANVPASSWFVDDSLADAGAAAPTAGTWYPGQRRVGVR